LTKAIAGTGRDADRLGRALAGAAGQLQDAKTGEAATRTAEETAREQADRIANAVRDARERVEAESHISTLTAKSRQWQDELEARRAALKGLEVSMRAAEDRLSHLNSEHAAIVVRTGLTVGKLCPVCLQVVRKTPGSPSNIASSIKVAEGDVQSARRRWKKGDEAVTEAISESRVADRALAEAKER